MALSFDMSYDERLYVLVVLIVQASPVDETSHEPLGAVLVVAFPKLLIIRTVVVPTPVIQQGK
ncbi:hypothetical protein ACHAXM_005467 [Skeletonema potamos]